LCCLADGGKRNLPSGACSFRRHRARRRHLPLPWGFIGSRYARFVDFVRGPTAVKEYANSLLKLEPAHHVGHNPAGGWAIVLLLGLGILSGLSGWAIYNDIGGHLAGGTCMKAWRRRC
jgi:hypothetical protein